MYHQDWFIRQIRYIIQYIARLIFNKSVVEYEIRDAERLTGTDELYLQMQRLLAENNLNEAESMLFDMLDPADYDCLLIALDFYMKANNLTDEELRAADFTRDEIEAGLNDIKRIYGIFF